MPRLRILTWNLWHALDPYGSPPFGHALMRPMESREEARVRSARQLEVLRSLRRGPGDVFCLQEVNPARVRTGEIGRALGWSGQCAVVNTGIKLGRAGLPPGLQEGLAIFAGEGFSERRFSETTLSGRALALGPFTAQLGERRKSLRFEGVLEGARIAVINLHLHNGSDVDPQALERKRREVAKLAAFCEGTAAELIVVCGDFNSDPASPCMEALLLAKFSEVSGQEPSWDPAANPLASKSVEHASSELARQWDAAPHVFDRIYVRSRRPIAEVRREQLRESGLSDHFAASVELVF